jgi:hypothetical protein
MKMIIGTVAITTLAAWWLRLGGGVSLIRTAITPRRLRWIS